MRVGRLQASMVCIELDDICVFVLIVPHHCRAGQHRLELLRLLDTVGGLSTEEWKASVKRGDCLKSLTPEVATDIIHDYVAPGGKGTTVLVFNHLSCRDALRLRATVDHAAGLSNKTTLSDVLDKVMRSEVGA